MKNILHQPQLTEFTILLLYSMQNWQHSQATWLNSNVFVLCDSFINRIKYKNNH